MKPREIDFSYLPVLCLYHVHIWNKIITIKLYTINYINFFPKNPNLMVQSNLSTKVSPRGITKVASVERWPLFRVSRDKIILAFVDLKPQLAGVLMHTFDCTGKWLSPESPVHYLDHSILIMWVVLISEPHCSNNLWQKGFKI